MAGDPRALRPALPQPGRLPHAGRARRGAGARRARGRPARGRGAQRRPLPRVARGSRQAQRPARAHGARRVPAGDAADAVPRDGAGHAAALPRAEVRGGRRAPPHVRAAAPVRAGDDPRRRADVLPRLLRGRAILEGRRLHEVLRAQGGPPAARGGPFRTGAALTRRAAPRPLRRDRGRLRGGRGDRRVPARGGRPPRARPGARAARGPRRVRRGRGAAVPAALQRGRAAARDRLPPAGPAGHVRRRRHDDQQRGLHPAAGQGARGLEAARARPRRRAHGDRAGVHLAAGAARRREGVEQGRAGVRQGRAAAGPRGHGRARGGEHHRRLRRLRLLQHRLPVRRQAVDARLRAPVGAAGLPRPRRRAGRLPGGEDPARGRAGDRGGGRATRRVAGARGRRDRGGGRRRGLELAAAAQRRSAATPRARSCTSTSTRR